MPRRGGKVFGRLSGITSHYSSSTRCISMGTNSVVPSVSTTRMTMNVGSLSARPGLNWSAKFILISSGSLMLVRTIGGVHPIMTRHLAKGMRIILCSNRNSIPSTTSKLSILTITKSIRLLHVPNLRVVFLAIPRINKATKLTAFILPEA